MSTLKIRAHAMLFSVTAAPEAPTTLPLVDLLWPDRLARGSMSATPLIVAARLSGSFGVGMNTLEGAFEVHRI